MKSVDCSSRKRSPRDHPQITQVSQIPRDSIDGNAIEAEESPASTPVRLPSHFASVYPLLICGNLRNLWTTFRSALGFSGRDGVGSARDGPRRTAAASAPSHRARGRTTAKGSSPPAASCNQPGRPDKPPDTARESNISSLCPPRGANAKDSAPGSQGGGLKEISDTRAGRPRHVLPPCHRRSRASSPARERATVPRSKGPPGAIQRGWEPVQVWLCHPTSQSLGSLPRRKNAYSGDSFPLSFTFCAFFGYEGVVTGPFKLFAVTL